MDGSQLRSILVPDRPANRRTDVDPPVVRSLLDVPRGRGRIARRREVRPGLQAPRLVSSYAGRIASLLFAFPATSLLDPPSTTAYRSLIAALPAGTRFTVACHEGTEDLIRPWFADSGHPSDSVTFAPLPRYVSFTDWAEDAYVAVHDGDEPGTHLVEPFAFPRAGDSLLADAVAEHAALGTAQAPLIFQGGNCLVGDDFWLLGRDYFEDSVALATGARPPVDVPSGADVEDLVREIFADFVDRDRRLLVFGTDRAIPLRPFYGTRDGARFFLDVPADSAGTFQPIFHIDMFVTLLGRETDGRFRVLVGSPRLADEVLGTRSPFGLDAVFDALADQLAAEGLAVTRNPLVHRPSVGRTFSLRQLKEFATGPDGDQLRPAVAELELEGATDPTPVAVRDWHHITWNNCLVERTASEPGPHNTVYLPTFGHPPYDDLAPLDELTAALWTGLGFRPVLLGDFNSFARRQGVVHCIKKYLARDEPQRGR